MTNKPDAIDQMGEDEVRVHAKQLESSVRNLLYIIRQIDREINHGIGASEIQDAERLTT